MPLLPPTAVARATVNGGGAPNAAVAAAGDVGGEGGRRRRRCAAVPPKPGLQVSSGCVSSCSMMMPDLLPRAKRLL